HEPCCACRTTTLKHHHEVNMRLVDWNIQWGRGVDNRVDLARIVAEAEALHDFDILCLQEVTRGFHESEAVIETDVGPLRIVSTHLEFYSEKQRLAQVARLRNLHAEACAHERQPAKAESQASPFADTARPHAAIVCGDFNSAFEGSAYRAMLEPFADAPSFV